MKTTVTGGQASIGHGSFVALQGVNVALLPIPDKWKVYIAVGLAGLQWILGALQHFSNPNGTPAAEAYKKEQPWELPSDPTVYKYVPGSGNPAPEDTKSKAAGE